MRIIIDMQGAQTESRFRGIGRYTMSLSQALVRIRRNHEIILALNGLLSDTIEPIRAAFDGLLPQENIRVWYAPGPVRECERGNDWWREAAERIREAFLASLHPDVVLVPSLFEGYGDDAVTSIGVFASTIPTAVTLHDLIPLINQDAYLKPNPLYETYYQRKIEHLMRADLLLAVSESSVHEARTLLGFRPEAVLNTSEGCDAIFRSMEIPEAEQRALKQKFGIDRSFVLYSGGADARKNLPRLIRAYAALPDSLRNIHQLVLAGKMPEGEVAQLREAARSAGLNKRELVFAGYVVEEELAQLYNLCATFVFPSLHEGFGLPALEAMSCGAPVIASNTTSLPEVIGLDAALFDPLNASSITAKMIQALSDESFRSMLRAHGLQQSKKFSWNESAQRVIATFELTFQHSSRAVMASDGVIRSLINAVARLTNADSIAESDQLAIAAAIAQNHPAQRRRRKLFVDISELVQRDAKTGVQRVTRSILRELLINPLKTVDVEAVYATTDKPGYRYARAFTKRFLNLIQHDTTDDPIDAQAGDIFFGLDLQAHVISAQMQVLRYMHRNGVRICFLMHDMLPVTMSQYFPPGTDVAHNDWMANISEFDEVICVSETVAREFRRWLATNKPARKDRLRISWSHSGADVENSIPTRGVPAEAGRVLDILRSRPSFLMVGTLEPRKRHADVLFAFGELWQSGHEINLVIVGKQGWLVDDLIQKLHSHPKLNSRLFWLDGISDEYLEEVYAASTCLIAASEGEGFGLPLIEAAQHKLPIIARDIPVFREVAGAYAYYFAGKGPEALVAAIKGWLALYAQDRHPKSDRMPWLTWKESAQRLLRLILREVNPRMCGDTGNDSTFTVATGGEDKGGQCPASTSVPAAACDQG